MEYKVLHQVLKDRKMNKLMSLTSCEGDKTFISKYFTGYGSGEDKETNVERRRAVGSGILARPLRTRILRRQG